VDEKIGVVAQHGGIGAHAAAAFVDPPALAGGIARPNERQRAPVRRRRAKTANLRLAHDGGRRKVGKADAVEDVLPGRQVLQEEIGGEVGIRQGGRRRG
jgi:hypothetical protein